MHLAPRGRTVPGESVPSFFDTSKEQPHNMSRITQPRQHLDEIKVSLPARLSQSEGLILLKAALREHAPDLSARPVIPVDPRANHLLVICETMTQPGVADRLRQVATDAL